MERFYYKIPFRKFLDVEKTVDETETSAMERNFLSGNSGRMKSTRLRSKAHTFSPTSTEAFFPHPLRRYGQTLV